MKTFRQRYPLRVGYETFMRVAHDLDSIVREHHRRCTCYAYAAETLEAVTQVYFEKEQHNTPRDLRTRCVRGAFTEDIWNRAFYVQMVWEDLPRRRPVRVAITIDRIQYRNTIEFTAIGVSLRAAEKIHATFGKRTLSYGIVKQKKK